MNTIPRILVTVALSAMAVLGAVVVTSGVANADDPTTSQDSGDTFNPPYAAP